MDDVVSLGVASGVGCVAAVATDYGYHRLMHVPFRRGPFRKLFLYHMAHHRYPEDPAILSFHDHRRLIDLFVLTLWSIVVAILQSREELLDAVTLAAAFVLPVAAYNWSYGAFHRWVHLGGDTGLARSWLMRRIRSHHLSHHAHRPGQPAFRRAHGYSLIFPFV